jgi:hypothetical protein
MYDKLQNNIAPATIGIFAGVISSTVIETILYSAVGFFTSIILKTLFEYFNKKLRKYLKLRNKPEPEI